MHHGRGLRRLTKDDELVAALSADYRQAPLADADRSMLDFATKLTVTPQDMNSADVEKLRSAGFDDRAIHDMVLVIGYFAFVNRVADGLGVTLEGAPDEAGS